MRQSILLGVVSAATIAACACGSASSTPAPTTPTPTPAPSAPAATTVLIVGSSGNTAFSPNPVQVAGGAQLTFRNNDSILHRIVVDGGGPEVGDIAPGATSQAITIQSTAAKTFHCLLHPTMVGSINGTSAPAPPDPNSPYPYATGR